MKTSLPGPEQPVTPGMANDNINGINKSHLLLNCNPFHYLLGQSLFCAHERLTRNHFAWTCCIKADKKWTRAASLLDKSTLHLPRGFGTVKIVNGESEPHKEPENQSNSRWCHSIAMV